MPGYFGGGSWDFYVRAIYHGTRSNDDETQFWMRHDYLYERAPDFWKGIVGWYIVRVANPDQALAVAKAIDAEFANSASESRTQTESAFAAAMVKQMGNIEFLITAIGAVVFFTLLLVTGNTMAIAVRERTNELATLKAIGFTASSSSDWCWPSHCSSRRWAGPSACGLPSRRQPNRRRAIDRRHLGDFKLISAITGFQIRCWSAMKLASLMLEHQHFDEDLHVSSRDKMQKHLKPADPAAYHMNTREL